MRTTRNNQEESLESTAIAVQEEKHPNFIESNTQAITLEELTNNNIPRNITEFYVPSHWEKQIGEVSDGHQFPSACL